MAQGALPYKYEEEKQTSGIPALAGLPVYMDLASGSPPSARPGVEHGKRRGSLIPGKYTL